MQIIALNGLTIKPAVDGRIGSYLPGSVEVYRWNWRAKDVCWTRWTIFTEIGSEPYILVGFSDGGTMAHRVAHLDNRCIGLVVHSGLRASIPRIRDIPTLLVTTNGDRTGCRQATEDMYDRYTGYVTNLTLAGVPFTRPHSWYERLLKHQFHNASGLINDWIALNY
jgi:hypothetical protein